MLIYSQQALSKLWNKYGWDVILLSSFLFFFVLIVGIFLSKKFHSYLFGVSNVSQENNTINTKHVRESGNIDVNPFNRQSNRSFFFSNVFSHFVFVVFVVHRKFKKSIESLEDSSSSLHNRQTVTPPTPSTADFISEKATSKGENYAREIIQELTGQMFYKTCPQWMLNPVSNKFLELDMYNDRLKLAVEYNGRQHYEYIDYFHKKKENFLIQQYRDELKKLYCEKEGVKLIVIPYTIKKQEDIKGYLEKELREYMPLRNSK